MTTSDVDQWLDRYFEAWRSNDPEQVAALFSADALYSVDPFAPAWRGRREIVERWTAGEGELLNHAHQVLWGEGSPVVVHWWAEIAEDTDSTLEMDGILLLEFNATGECTSHREWYGSRRNQSDLH